MVDGSTTESSVAFICRNSSSQIGISLISLLQSNFLCSRCGFILCQIHIDMGDGFVVAGLLLLLSVEILLVELHSLVVILALKI